MVLMCLRKFLAILRRLDRFGMTLMDLIGEQVVSCGKRLDPKMSFDSRLREDLGFDSLELAVLTVKIEAEFGVDVFADGVVNTVGEIEEKIQRHLDSISE